MCFLGFLENNPILPSYDKLQNPTEQQHRPPHSSPIWRAAATERGGGRRLRAVDAGGAGEGV
jgi:hypothetical protein